MLSTDWSADGQFIVFHTPSNSTRFDISAIDLSREDGRVRVPAGLANEIHGSVSPDSQRIAFASDESGRYEIYVQEFPEPANKVLVSTNGGVQPRWRQDGLELLYVQADGTLMAVPIRTSPTFDHDPPVPLFKTRLQTTVNPYRWDYVPARDGQRFVMKMPAAETSETSITVVLNWTALLTK